MDKKLLEALDNLSYSLELIADALNSRESSNTSTTNALKSGDFSKQLNEINTSLKSIKSDTSKILQNQNTILELSKKNSNNREDIFSGADNNKEKLKNGASSIILIAGAVLAIGMAFKIVGDVDFLSVIAIGLSIVFISEAFINVANNVVNNKITNAVAMQTSIVMIAIAASIMLSSWLLGFIKPISLAQASSAILIAGMFSIVSYGIKKILDAMGSSNIVSVAKSVIFLPLILPAISASIALSSYVLGLTKPVGLIQAVSAILIAGVFTVISFGLARIMKSVDEIKNPSKVLLLPIVMVALAGAIALSSSLIASVQPITLAQFITSAAISILFVALSYGLSFMGPFLDKIKLQHVLLLPLLFTSMSLAIAASSKILMEAEEIPFGKSLKILVFGAVMTVLTFTMGTAMTFLGKASIKDILAGALAIVVLAGAILVSSKILALGDYSIYPSIGWAVGTGLSILAFGAAAIATGLLVTSGIGAVALLAGAVAIIGIAGTIVAVSHILKAGDYSKYPALGWAAGVGLSMGGFGMAMLGIGMAIVGSLGIGLIALEAGKNAVLMIAQTVVDASHILKAGDYKGGPTISWSAGIALALGAFSPIYAMLVANKIMSLFGGGVGPKDFQEAIILIADGIKTAALKFRGMGNIFNGGPNKEWAEGVGLAISAFAPVYSILLKNSGIFKSNISPEDFSNAINVVTDGIISVSGKFKGIKFSDGPTKEWAEGIGGSINAFLPIFNIMNDSGFLGMGKTDIDDIKGTINSITDSIIQVAAKFNRYRNIFNPINPNFIKSLSSTTLGFLDLANKIDKKEGLKNNLFGESSISTTANGMITLAGAYDKLASSLRRFSGALRSMDEDKVSSIRKLTANLAILASMNKKNLDDMMSTLESKSGVFSKLIQDSNNKSITPVAVNKKGNNDLTKKDKKSKYGNTSEQLDMVIDILTRIDTSTTSLDEFMASKGFRPTSLTNTSQQNN